MILAAGLVNHPVSLTEDLSFLSENAKIICIKLLRSSKRIHSFSSVICPCVDTANLRLSLG